MRCLNFELNDQRDNGSSTLKLQRTNKAWFNSTCVLPGSDLAKQFPMRDLLVSLLRAMQRIRAEFLSDLMIVTQSHKCGFSWSCSSKLVCQPAQKRKVIKKKKKKRQEGTEILNTVMKDYEVLLCL